LPLNVVCEKLSGKRAVTNATDEPQAGRTVVYSVQICYIGEGE